uniref:Deacetylase sirtuin-type domain-containing protein n=2 Tax=Alexandrium monilatum TaxID=311494 RepID=A0A6T0V3W0_9DINO|mmetsp:Transcript_8601/g.26124  ORF Transcript_8601/g.26124 Transcript_8601/m.26124 type:complete len:201 (+) Transcript_8601:163-765(+)
MARQRAAGPSKRPRPNNGHAAVAELAASGRLDLLVTQNVDGLHQEAGVPPERVVEIHGSTRSTRCLDCGHVGPIDETLDRFEAGERDPKCRQCGGMLKTATISFGQALVEEDLDRAFRAARECDLLLAIGSTLSVYPVAGIVPEASRAGARVVIVNLQPTEMDELADVVLRAPISEVLPPLLAAAQAPRCGAEGQPAAKL